MEGSVISIQSFRVYIYTHTQLNCILIIGMARDEEYDEPRASRGGHETGRVEKNPIPQKKNRDGKTNFENSFRSIPSRTGSGRDEIISLY